MTAQFFFVGEKPSARARVMRVTWVDGRLAAKQLFDALSGNGLDPRRQEYANLFRGSRLNRQVIARARASAFPVVAMGQKVQKALAALDIPFIPLIHPAARGAIRRKARYIRHVRVMLGGRYA